MVTAGCSLLNVVVTIGKRPRRRHARACRIGQAGAGKMGGEFAGRNRILQRESLKGPRANQQHVFGPRQRGGHRGHVQERAHQHAPRPLAGPQRHGSIRRRRDDPPPAQRRVFERIIPDVEALDAVPIPLAAEDCVRQFGAQRERLLDRGGRVDFRHAVCEPGDHRGSRPQHIENHARRPRQIAAWQVFNLGGVERGIQDHRHGFRGDHAPRWREKPHAVGESADGEVSLADVEVN